MPPDAGFILPVTRSIRDNKRYINAISCCRAMNGELFTAYREGIAALCGEIQEPERFSAKLILGWFYVN